MSKNYWFTFGTNDSRVYTGLSPTFILFFDGSTGQTLPPPGFTELLAGSGFYRVAYSVTTQIIFEIDAGGSVPTADRYLKGTLDPLASVDQKIGSSADSFGSTNTDPASIYGLVKRMQEWLEGNAIYDKSTAVWSVYSRGSSTLLAQKSLSNTTSLATKS